jgi:NAD(P)-dependent dehydrogenase (short-subunit alcohol dehydrogenase family)
VNNAGIEKKIPFVDYPLEEWQKIFAVNLTGPFLCSQSAARQMIQQGGGRIINISSVHEDLPMQTNAPGPILFTVIPCGANSTAIVRISIRRPPFVAQYGGMLRNAGSL